MRAEWHKKNNTHRQINKKILKEYDKEEVNPTKQQETDDAQEPKQDEKRPRQNRNENNKDKDSMREKEQDKDNNNINKNNRKNTTKDEWARLFNAAREKRQQAIREQQRQQSTLIQKTVREETDNIPYGNMCGKN